VRDSVASVFDTLAKAGEELLLIAEFFKIEAGVALCVSAGRFEAAPEAAPKLVLICARTGATVIHDRTNIGSIVRTIDFLNLISAPHPNIFST
jgi:hypothetical protein